MPAKKKTAAKTLKQGDHVSWNTSQGRTQGVVQKKLTRPMKIKDHQVSASTDNPEYLVKSDQSGELAAHKPESLRKTPQKSTARKSVAKKSAATKSAAKR
ncbi:MAG: HVA1 family protein [Gemmatimonas sp.]